jgi:hypothetical protein
MGLSNSSAPDSPSDEGDDILSKLSPCLLHHMMHIQDCALIVWSKWWVVQTEALLSAVMRLTCA